MKKYLFIIGLLIIGTITYAAPQTSFFRSIEPEGNLQYFIGSTTNRWLNLYTQNASTSLAFSLGTSTPSILFPFNIQGSGQFTGTSTFGGIIATSTIQLKTLATGSALCARIQADGTLTTANADCGTGTPGGSDSQIQYNNGGVFGGTNNFVFDDTTNRVGIGTTTPGSLLSVQGVANFAVGTSTIFSGVQLPTLTATSGITVTGGSILATNIGATFGSTSVGGLTSANGVTLTGGCFKGPTGNCLGVGGTPTATVTTDLSLDCDGSRSNLVTNSAAAGDIVPGNAYFGPLESTSTSNSITPFMWFMGEATSSEIACITVLPSNLASTPNASLRIVTVATSSGGQFVMDLDAIATTTANTATTYASYDPKNNWFTNLMASTSTAFPGTADIQYIGSTTIRSFTSPSLVAGGEFILRIRRFGADASDNLRGDLGLERLFLQVDINVN